MTRGSRTSRSRTLIVIADPGVEKEARAAGASGFLAKGIGLGLFVIVLHEAADTDGEF